MADFVRASHPVYGTRVIPASWVATYPGAWTPLDGEDPGPNPDPLPLYMRDEDLDAAAAALVGTGGPFDVAQRAASVAAVEDAEEVAPAGAWDFAQAPTVAGLPIDGGGEGVTDHGALTGLADDDHPQYLNEFRGDARYAQGAHTHPVGDLTATGTPSDSTFLRGDGTWAAPVGEGGGVTDHSALTGRTAADSHPIAAITGLQGALDGKQPAGSYATPTDVTTASTADRARANHTGTQSLDTTTDSATRLAMTTGERTKLAGVATAATANATDAQLRDRSTHTGSQPASTISDSTTVGRSVLTATDAAAARTAIGAGTSNLAIGTTSATAKAGDYSPPADAAAGTASMRTLGTGALQAAAGNDSRFTNARTPTAHASTHATGGSDLLTPAAIGAAPVSALWAPSTVYAAGQLVVNAGQVYAAAVSHTSGASFVASNWTAVNPGELGYAQIVSNFDTTVGAGVDVTGLSITVTVGTRPILLDFAGYLTNLSANVYTIAQLWDATANVQLVECAWNFPTASVVDRKTASIRVSPAAGTRTYKMRLSCTGGTARIAGSAASPAFLQASQV